MRTVDIVKARSTRRDGNIFSCLADPTQDGDEWKIDISDSDDTEEMVSDKSDKSDSSETVFREVRRKKKRKLNSSSASANVGGNNILEDEVDYKSLSTEEKLDLILSKVSVNEARFRNLEQIYDKVYKQQKHISKLDSVVLSYEDRIKLLEYKSIDLEARSRRNNLLFHGLKESRDEDCKNIIRQFLSDHFEISVSETAISRAHRIGRYDRNRIRPVIVAFQEYVVTESIIKKGNVLRDSNYSVSRDYPIEITRARKTLWPSYKQLKQQNPLSRVAIVYPARLILDGKTMKDLFPEWDEILRGSRIDMTHPSQQSCYNDTRKTGSCVNELNHALQSTPCMPILNKDHV